MKRLIISLFLSLVSISATAEEVINLPSLGALSNQTSISGLSSGAFMATQFDVAYSKSIVGVGVVAGGPWGCASSHSAILELPLLTATTTCMTGESGGFPNAHYLVRAAKLASAEGYIDNINNVKNDRVYIFSGTEDTVVKTGVTDATFDFYQGNRMSGFRSHFYMLTDLETN